MQLLFLIYSHCPQAQDKPDECELYPNLTRLSKRILSGKVPMAC